MADARAEQVLFGYSRGHRVLASSIDLDSDATRLLRTASDMAFDGVERSFLSLLPVQSAGSHAFIKTWPATDWTRPGSVWSHVLLVKYADLAQMDDLAAILKQFRRPPLEDGILDDKVLSTFKAAVTLPATLSPKFRIDTVLASRALPALYGSKSIVRLQVEDSALADETLMAIFEQQWPRLRRTSSFRTRYRTSDAAWRVDLEVLERVPPGKKHEPHRESSSSADLWTSTLLNDLVVPSPEFRSFLRRYGAESVAGRADMRPLTQLFQVLRTPEVDPPSVLAQLVRSYPDPDSMRGLKRDLFGRSDHSEFFGWPVAESARIRFALSVSQIINLTDLDLVRRLIDLIASGDPSALKALGEIDFEVISPEQVEMIISEVIATAGPEMAIHLATAQPDLGVLIASRKPELVAEPTLWDSLDEDLLLEVFSRQDERTRHEIADELLYKAADGPLASLCSADPSIWWTLLLRSAKQSSEPEEVLRNAHVLRRVLARVGAAVLDAPRRKPSTYRELLTLVLAGDLSAGLWKRATPAAWLRAANAREADSLPFESLPSFAVDRFNVVTLLSAAGSGQPALREEGWALTFAPLHEALKNPGFDSEAWSLLGTSLPQAEQWDRCRRLRRGAVAEIRRDKWDASATQGLIAGAAEFRTEMRAELSEQQLKKKKRTWLQELLDVLQ